MEKWIGVIKGGGGFGVEIVNSGVPVRLRLLLGDVLGF